MNGDEELFTAALALPAVEREIFLRRACDGRSELLQRVKILLDAFEDGAAFVKEPASWPDADSIGGYRLLHEIGEGGCATVYLAEQLTPLRREVAIKIIKLGMDTKAVIARFEAERQALALMDHPNIARVFDAGATASGRPYFAMELVRGIRITDYSNHVHLDIPERLALLIQVCQAIQHAHRKGIIHRDIKPSNVLVTLHDGEPVAKVIDFGIAKATLGRLTDQTFYTALEPFLGTPAYVSPEQTDPNGAQIDERSDVYSLGVLLYELLTGCTPFADARPSPTGLEEIRRRIRAEEPVPPSKRLRALLDEQPSATSVRDEASTARLTRKIHADLDWIVMRCLEKDRADRYQTAGELASDLQRYLRHEPVVARPRRMAYTFRKFARRNRAWLAAGTAVATVLLVATSVSLWLAVRAMQAERVAQEVADFLRNDVLAQASPLNEPDRDVKLRTVLDRAAERLDSRLSAPSSAEASVHETFAATYESLGEYTKSLQHIDRAIAIYTQLSGSEDERALRLMSTSVRMQTRQGNYAAAVATGEKALELQRRALGPTHLDTLAMHTALGEAYMQVERYSEAETLVRAALEVQERELGPAHVRTTESLTELASICVVTGRLDEAEALVIRVRDANARVYGPEHPETLRAMGNLGSIYLQQHRLELAQAQLTQTLATHTRVLGSNHPDSLHLMATLARLQWEQGRFTESTELERQIVDIARRVRGTDHPYTLIAINNFAKSSVDQGKSLDEAEALQREVHEKAQRAFGPEHTYTLGFKLNLASTYRLRGKLAASEALLAEGLATAQRLLGNEHHHTLEYLDNLAAIRISQRQFAAAETLLRLELRGYERFAADKWWVISATNRRNWQLYAARSRLGEALAGQGRFGEAETLLLDGFHGLQLQADSILARYRPDLREAAARLQQLYVAWNKPEKAREWRELLGTILTARSPEPERMVISAHPAATRQYFLPSQVERFLL